MERMKGLIFSAVIGLLSVSSASAGDRYVRFGEGYLVDLSDNLSGKRLTVGNSSGINVAVGQYVYRELAVQGEYADYSNGLSVGLFTFHLDLNDAPNKSFDPFMSIGAGSMNHRSFGTGGAVKSSAGLNYSFQPFFSPKLTLGFESSLVRGIGAVHSVLYISNSLMFAVNF